MRTALNAIGVTILVLGLTGLWIEHPFRPETLLMTGMSLLYVIGTVKWEKDNVSDDHEW